METSGLYSTISNDFTEVYRSLPLKLQLAYGVGHVLNDVCASMWFTYLLVFFQLVLQFSRSQAGLILLIGQVADAVATPFVGFHSDSSDNFWLCRYGRRKTWHLLGSVCVLAAFPFIFSACISCENSPKSEQLFYYSIFVIIFQFGWASIQISHLSLIPELTPNEHDRTKLTAIRYSFTVFSNILIYIITWFVLHMNSTDDSQIGPGDEHKFEIVVWIGTSTGLFCTIIFHVFVKEDNNINSDIPGNSSNQVSFMELFSGFEVYQCAVIYMSTRLFMNLSQVFIPLYLHETLNMAAQSLAIVPLIMYLGSFVMSLFTGFLNRKFGRKITYILGTILGVVACTWIQLGSGHDYVSYEIYAVAFLLGASASIVLVTSLGLTADLIGTNTGSGAFVYGLMSFTDKLANGVAVVVIQNTHNHSSIYYYRDILTYVCGGSVLLGCLGVVSLFRSIRDRRQYLPVPESENFDNARNIAINTT